MRLLIALVPSALIVFGGLALLSRTQTPLAVRTEANSATTSIRPFQSRPQEHESKKIILGNNSLLAHKRERHTAQSNDAISNGRTLTFCLPYAPGNSFKVSQAFDGETHHGQNRYAVDFMMRVGTPVHAARSGKVVRIVRHFDQSSLTEEDLARANVIVIQHDDETYASYGHLEKDGSAVEIGQQVKPGQLLGYSGNTGFSSGPHLHFEAFHYGRDKKYESLPFTFVAEDDRFAIPTRNRSYTAVGYCE